MTTMTYNNQRVIAYPCDCRSHWIYSNCGEVYCELCDESWWFLDLGLTTDNISCFYDENNIEDVEMLKWYRIEEAGGEMQYSYKMLKEGKI